MPKAILEFNLPDEDDWFQIATKAGDMKMALEEVRNKIFRPARKHGYQDVELRHAFDAGKMTEFMELLEAKFTEIVADLHMDI